MGYTRIPAATGVGAITNIGTSSPIPIRDPATSWYHPIPGSGVIQNQPPSAIAPSLSAADLTQSSGSYVVFDSILLTATTADSTDLLTTTSVDLYESGVLVGSMTQISSGTWTYTVSSITSGAKSYTARRHYTPAGIIDSSPVALTVLGAMAPTDITTATLLAYFLAPDSIQMGTTLEASGSSPPTVTIASASTLVGRTEGVYVECTTLGNPGTAKVKISLDNGNSFVETNVTVPTTPFTHLISGTDLTLTFGNAAYSTNNIYRAICNPWLDKVGAYPSSTANFTNVTGGTRPYIISATDSRLGAPCIRFDGVNDISVCAGAPLATALSGAAAPFYIFQVADVRALPAAAAAGVFYCASNVTDTDLPFVQMATFGTGPVWRAQRRSDTGSAVTAASNVMPGADQNITEDMFDGTTRKLTINGADVIGGDSGVSANTDQSGKTVTTTQIALGAQCTQAAPTGAGSTFGNFDLYALAFFNQEPSAVERARLRAWVFT